MCKIKFSLKNYFHFISSSVINYFIVTKSANFSTDVSKGEAELTAEMLHT